MRDIELEFRVARVHGVKNFVDFTRTLSQRVHVIVKSQLDANIGRALAEIGQQVAHVFVIVVGDQPIFRPRADHLQVIAAGIVRELRMIGMHRQLRFGRRVDVQIAAGKRHKFQFVLIEQIVHGLRAAIKFRNGVRAQLNPGEAQCGNCLLYT